MLNTQLRFEESEVNVMLSTLAGARTEGSPESKKRNDVRASGKDFPTLLSCTLAQSSLQAHMRSANSVLPSDGSVLMIIDNLNTGVLIITR